MHVYRLAKKTYIGDLSGTGARIYGGRWNHQGIAALYSSEHRSLAILEFIVHASLHTLPPDLALLTLFIPDDILSITIRQKELPANWRSFPAPFKLADKGTQWILSEQSLLLYVPSVIIPGEWNIVINPRHSLFEKIEIKAIDSFDLDSRFLKIPDNDPR